MTSSVQFHLQITQMAQIFRIIPITQRRPATAKRRNYAPCLLSTAYCLLFYRLPFYRRDKDIFQRGSDPDDIRDQDSSLSLELAERLAELCGIRHHRMDLHAV